MTKATNNVARVAAAVAGLGLVAMSFAPAVGAQTMTSMTTTSSMTTMATFTRDLTVGSTGSDVMSLQTWLMGKGYSIPAGATGYFGAQTKAALAAYQAANGIMPAAGYFGPITRAKVMSMGGSMSTSTSTVPGCMAGAMFSSTTGASCAGSTTTTTTSTTLSGGEADLRDYDLRSGDDLMEDDSDTEIASAKFDVTGGDVEVQRVTVDLQPVLAATAANQHPWEYIDSLSVYSGDKKIGDVDAGSKDDWDQEDDDSDHSGSYDYYSIDIPVSGVLKEGADADLSIRADAQGSIDTDDQDQTFKLQIPDEGIRAVDSTGIQQYTGNDGEEVTFGFDEEESGDLTIRESSDNPDAGVLVADEDETSDDFDVLKFEIKNKDDSDADFNELTFNVATSSAATTTGAHNITNIIRRATLTLDGDDYDGDINANNTIDFDDLDTTVGGNDTIDGTLTVSLYSQRNHYAATGESLDFNLTSGNVDAEGSDSGDASDVSGTVDGNIQSIGVDTGITIDGNSNSTSESYNSTTPSSSTGTFVLKFDVTANGDDVYVPRSISAISSSTTPGANTGVVVVTDLAASTTSSSVSSSLTSTADAYNGSYYVVHDGDTETFTANVTIDPTMSGYYQVGLDRVRFSDTPSTTGLQTLDVDQTDSDFQTDQQYIH